jgi:hypothetical protein
MAFRNASIDGSECRLWVLAVSKRFRPEVGTERRGDLNCFFCVMLPARDPSLLAGGATPFDGAALTGVGPVPRRRTKPFSSFV